MLFSNQLVRFLYFLSPILFNYVKLTVYVNIAFTVKKKNNITFVVNVTHI